MRICPDMRPASLQKQTSAGGVIFKKNNNSVQIILVSVRNGQSWCLPKGIVNKGETTEEAALREVNEETGLIGRIIDDLGHINYWYYIKEENIKCRKTVFFFLMEYISGDTADHDREVDEAGWFSPGRSAGKSEFQGRQDYDRKGHREAAGTSFERMKKILDRKGMQKISCRLRAEGKKIVFTNGCFDILHAGHVRYLGQARRLGDVLIVGLNSDRSVSGIKPGRPINSEKNRALVLAALAAVDYVVVFSEKTPYNLIKAIKPDILVKGGDWKKEDIIGSDIAKETLSLPFLKGISTTGIIEKIIRNQV